MALILDGTNGLSDVDGSAATPAIRGSDANTGVFFGTDIVGVSTGGSERVRVDASGNVGIGTSSPAFLSGGGLAIARTGTSAELNVTRTDASTAGGLSLISGNAENIIRGSGAKALTFDTNSTERARIDSSGNLLVGVTSTAGGGGSIVSRSGDGAQVFQMQHTGASDPYGTYINYLNAAPNGTSNNFIQCNDSAAIRMTVRSNGGIANFSGNNVNLSDRREKTNFAPAKSYLNTICAIPVQTFNYIDQNMEEDPGLTLGVVAQDVQEVAPELVMESNWGTEEAPKQRLSIYQTDLQYALMKAIQEQQAIITALTARVEALEGAQA
jgi:hypothetical protein